MSATSKCGRFIFSVTSGIVHVVQIRDLQLVQWIGYGLQMLVRQMQVDESVFEGGMTE